MDMADKLVWWAVALLVGFVVASCLFLILAIDTLEQWRERRAARNAREGDASRP